MQSKFINIERRIVSMGEVAFSKAEQINNEVARTLVTTYMKRSDLFKAWW